MLETMCIIATLKWNREIGSDGVKCEEVAEDN
jgi:hypothetical protein